MTLPVGHNLSSKLFLFVLFCVPTTAHQSEASGRCRFHLIGNGVRHAFGNARANLLLRNEKKFPKNQPSACEGLEKQTQPLLDGFCFV